MNKVIEDSARSIYNRANKSRQAELVRLGRKRTFWSRWNDLSERDKNHYRASAQALQQNKDAYNANNHSG